MSEKEIPSENEPMPVHHEGEHFFVGDLAPAIPEPIPQADGDGGDTSATRGKSGQSTPMGAWRPVPQNSLSGEEVGTFRPDNNAAKAGSTNIVHSDNDLASSSRIDVEPHVDHKRPADDDGVRRSPNPVSGNYPGDLWRSHTRRGGVQSLVRSSRRVGGRNDCETADD